MRKSVFKTGESKTNFKLKYMLIGHLNIVMMDMVEIEMIAGITLRIHPRVTLVIDFTSFFKPQSSDFCSGGLNLKCVFPIVHSVSELKGRAKFLI